MQIVVSQCTRLARLHIEYLDVQQRQVISACMAAEGDVWCVLPLFLHFIRIREIHRPTTVCHLFRWFDEPLIECPDIIGGFELRWCQVASMMEADSLLAPLDATLSTCWLWCGQLLPIPTDQKHQHAAAICVALTLKNCFTTSTVGYISSCTPLMPTTELLILYLDDVTPRHMWCNIPWIYDPI